MFVPAIDIAGDGVDELSDTIDCEALKLAGREFGEEAFNEIQPRRRGRREVEVHARVLVEPSHNGRMLMGGVVVENDVDVELGRNGTLDFAQKSEKLLVPVAWHAFVEHFTCGDVQGSEQGRRAVTLVVMRHSSSPPLLQR